MPKEILDKLTSDYENEQLVSIRIKFKIEKQDGTNFDAIVNCYLKKTEANFGCDDLIRQSMPVSGERKFEQRDANALTLIEDGDTAEFCRQAESENHKTLDVTTLREKNIYISPSNELRLIKNLSYSFHTVLIESDSEAKSTDATKDWFSFGDDSDEESDTSSDSDGDGKITKFKIPQYLFDDPKIYEIRKVQKKNKYGFIIFGSDIKKTTEKNLNEIKKILEIDLKKKGQIEDDETKNTTIKEEDLERLKKQKKKLEKRLINNCNDLFPCSVRIHLYEDLQKYGGKRSKKFYDPVNDFDLKKDINKYFQVDQKGIKNLQEGKEEGNLISFRVDDKDFSYELLTNKLSSKKGIPSDLTVRPWVGRADET